MSIKLSPEHGVNPSLEQCFVCLKDVGVILFGKISNQKAAAFNKAGLPTGRESHNDHESPRKVCLNREPCDECKGHMEQGVILISVDESKSEDLQNPWRTGGWCVVTEAFIKRVFNPPELVKTVLEQRLAFMPDDAWDMIGLPRGDSDGVDI